MVETSILNEAIRTPEGVVLYEKIDIDNKSKHYRNRPKNIFKKWDVYWAAVRFEDDQRHYKIRPIVILGYKDKDTVKAIYGSSVDKCDRYRIKNHLSMGLVEPTYLMYKKEESVPIMYIFDPTTKPLSKEDIRNIEDLWLESGAPKNVN